MSIIKAAHKNTTSETTHALLLMRYCQFPSIAALMKSIVWHVGKVTCSYAVVHTEVRV